MERSITSVWEAWTHQGEWTLESLSQGQFFFTALGGLWRNLVPKPPPQHLLPQIIPTSGKDAVFCSRGCLELSKTETGNVLLLEREVPTSASAKCTRCPSQIVFSPLTELADGFCPSSAHWVSLLLHLSSTSQFIGYCMPYPLHRFSSFESSSKPCGIWGVLEEVVT